MQSSALSLLALVACSPAKVTPSTSDDSVAPADDTGDGPAPTDDTGTPDETGDSGDDSDTSGGETGETGAMAPPVSSRCIEAADTTGACTNGVYAEDWTGTVRYEWKVTDGYNHSVLRAVEGGVSRDITEIATLISWHMTGGLTVMPDGDLLLAGITLPYVTLTVGADSVDLGPDYVRFIARVSPEGELRWVETFIGVTGESVVVAARSDDSAIVSGFVYQDTDFGSSSVTTTMLWDMAFAAAIDGDGTWLWATTPPLPSSGNTRVYFDDMTLNDSQQAELQVRYLSSTDVSVGSFTCAARATCAATVTVDADGSCTDVVAR